MPVLISCPFSLAITPEVSKNALLSLLKSPPSLDKWTERQLICSYLSLHWVVGNSDSSSDSFLSFADTFSAPDKHSVCVHPAHFHLTLFHLPYINILPAADNCELPCISPNMNLMVSRHKSVWRHVWSQTRLGAEWKDCKELVEHTIRMGYRIYMVCPSHLNCPRGAPKWDLHVHRKDYLTAADIPIIPGISISILSSTPSLEPRTRVIPSFYQEWLLNHAPSVAVSWIIGSVSIYGSLGSDLTI